MSRILIVPDKFKGSLSARQAAGAIARGWHRARPGDSINLLPMSDGGDGFGEVLAGLLGAVKRTVTTVDAAHRKLRCAWWWSAGTRTAIVESANVMGMALFPRKKHHPFQLDTFGLEKVLRAAEKAGARRTVIGIGGSATNDGGFGLALALGWRFFGHYGEELEEWWQLIELTEIRAPAAPLKTPLIAAVDVRNPLLGPSGCSRIYGPQKGLRPEDFDLAEKCLARLASALREQHHISGADVPGAGAAGGLGFGLTAFAGASIQSGFDWFARHARLEKRIRAADVVITGEGAMDGQTLMGKGVGQIALCCACGVVPCVGLAGVVEKSVRKSPLFARAAALTDLADLPRAKSQALRWLERLSEATAREWNGP
jgi:glycerate kinase